MLIGFFINKNAVSERAMLISCCHEKKYKTLIDEERMPVLLLTDI